MPRMIFLLFPGFELLDFTGPVQVFHDARKGGMDLEMLFCGTQESLCCEQGLQLADLAPVPDCRAGDWLFVPGFSPGITTPPAGLAARLRRAHAQGARIVSTCTGAFILGKAGLLDGRDCTTHWKRLGELQAGFPGARVRENCIFVEDGPIVTCGGVTCGIDLALYLVEREAGPAFALRVARELNVYIRRDGDHSQKSVYIDYRNHNHPGIHAVQDWLAEHPAENLTLAGLAALGGLSVRHFSREFRAATGISTGEYRTLLRLEHARILLNDPHLSVDGVAAACGFRDARQLRRLWRERFNASPRQETADRPAKA